MACSISGITFLFCICSTVKGKDLTFLHSLHKLSIKEICSWYGRKVRYNEDRRPVRNHQFLFSSTFRPFSRCVDGSSLFSFHPLPFPPPFIFPLPRKLLAKDQLWRRLMLGPTGKSKSVFHKNSFWINKLF